MFGAFKAALEGNVKKYSGQKDFLEAVCAAAALVAAADGDIGDDEADAMLTAVQSNAALSASFKGIEIEQCADAMLNRAKGGRMGRLGLKREIEQAAADPDKAEAILMAALDVADQGGISDKEKAVLRDIASSLKLNLDKYM